MTISPLLHRVFVHEGVPQDRNVENSSFLWEFYSLLLVMISFAIVLFLPHLIKSIRSYETAFSNRKEKNVIPVDTVSDVEQKTSHSHYLLCTVRDCVVE